MSQAELLAVIGDADDDGTTKGVCTFADADFDVTAGVVTLASSGMQSSVYFTGASNSGSGTISAETYEADTVPSDKVLTGFASDDDTVTVLFGRGHLAP